MGFTAGFTAGFVVGCIDCATRSACSKVGGGCCGLAGGCKWTACSHRRLSLDAAFAATFPSAATARGSRSAATADNAAARAAAVRSMSGVSCPLGVVLKE
jgi:hypothetical protein